MHYFTNYKLSDNSKITRYWIKPKNWLNKINIERVDALSFVKSQFFSVVLMFPKEYFCRFSSRFFADYCLGWTLNYFLGWTLNYLYYYDKKLAQFIVTFRR